MENLTHSNYRTRDRQHNRRRRKRRGRLWAAAIPLLALVLYLSFNVFSSSLSTNDTSDYNNLAQTAEPDADSPTQNGTDRSLILVNPWNSLPDGYEITLTQLINEHAVDERCYPDLQELMDDCRTAGLSPLICSSYRTQENQEQLYNNKVNSLIVQGYSEADAKVEAGTVIAIPGTSEHQTGLAVDIVDINNQNLDSSQENTAVQQWLMQNSWKYGFILRYPSDKSDITGIIYEPWHYRYVGKETARYIYENEICLEEYLELLG